MFQFSEMFGPDCHEGLNILDQMINGSAIVTLAVHG